MTLYYQQHNSHQLTVDGRHLLFHVPSTSLFEIDQLDYEVLDLLKRKPTIKQSDLQQHFEAKTDPQALVERLQSLIDLQILAPHPLADKQTALEINNFPLTTLVLNVNTGCNLACNYCYKEDLASPSAGQKMAFDTAVASIEMLLKESPDREQYNLVFFGGEPLSNIGLIKQIVAHADQRFAEFGARADYTLTTTPRC